MKAITVAVMVMLFVLISCVGNIAYAFSPDIRTEHVIFVTVIIRGDISLDLEDEWVYQNLQKPEAEAFSELKEEGIFIEKIGSGNSTLWLFTKTK